MVRAKISSKYNQTIDKNVKDRTNGKYGRGNRVYQDK